MELAKLVNFADFFLIALNEDLTDLEENLIEAGLIEISGQDHILDMLKQKRAELLIQTGRKFKENYLKLKNQNSLRNSENEIGISELALAFRKKSGNSDKVEDTDSNLLELIKQAKNRTK